MSEKRKNKVFWCTNCLNMSTRPRINFVGDGLEKARFGLLEQGFSLGEWDIEKARSLKNRIMI